MKNLQKAVLSALIISVGGSAVALPTLKTPAFVSSVTSAVSSAVVTGVSTVTAQAQTLDQRDGRNALIGVIALTAAGYVGKELAKRYGTQAKACASTVATAMRKHKKITAGVATAAIVGGLVAAYKYDKLPTAVSNGISKTGPVIADTTTSVLANISSAVSSVWTSVTTGMSTVYSKLPSLKFWSNKSTVVAVPAVVEAAPVAPVIAVVAAPVVAPAATEPAVMHKNPFGFPHKDAQAPRQIKSLKARGLNK